MKSIESLVSLSAKVDFGCRVSTDMFIWKVKGRVTWAFTSIRFYKIAQFCLKRLQSYMITKPPIWQLITLSEVWMTALQWSINLEPRLLHQATASVEENKLSHPEITCQHHHPLSSDVFLFQTLPLISQSRRLVREGPVTELMDFSLKETERNIYLHLFNDYLLLSQQKEWVKQTRHHVMPW